MNKNMILEVILNKIKRNTKAFRKENLYNAGRKWTKDTIDDKHNEHIDTLPSGHEIHKSYNTVTGQHVFHAYDPKTKRSTITVQGRLKNGVLSKPYLAAHEENTLPAHKFYSHLLNRGHLNAVSTDSQSPGAQRVWSKLSKEKGVGIHGWHKGKPVNIKYGEDETHDKEKGGDPSVRDMRLIAHAKKPLKEETKTKTLSQFINRIKQK